MPPMIRNPRLLAVRLMETACSRRLLLTEAADKLAFDLSPRDRNLAFELAYGAFRFAPGLEKRLNAFLKKPVHKLRDPLRLLLTLTAYQLYHMRVPAYAAINEANQLTVKLGFKGLKPMVNGVLRNLARAAEAGEGRDEAMQTLPDWLESLLREQHGKVVDGWIEAWRERPLTSYWTLDEPLDAGDPRSPYLPHAREREGGIERDTLEQSRVYVQNETSQLIAELCLRQSPKRVLDLCAAPGGKSCYMAAHGDLERLTAVDPSPERVALIEANQRRLGLCFETVTALGQEADVGDDFDLVLVDAPCSAIGTIGRHPEIKMLRQKPADEETLALQKALLEAGLARLRPGGVLVFAVCSLDQREVPEPPAAAEPAPELLADWPPAEVAAGREGCRFVIHPSRRTDGFSGMVLRKLA